MAILIQPPNNWGNLQGKPTILADDQITWSEIVKPNSITLDSLTTYNNNLELGSSTFATTPYIDFHSGQPFCDYDSRIIASGGTGTIGGGNLNFVSKFIGTGAIFINNNSSSSTSTTTGASIIAGGQGIAGNQYIGGFSSLGGNADHPPIKIKILEGTTASSQGAFVEVLHGLTASKIISVSTIVFHAPGCGMMPGYDLISGYYFYTYFNQTLFNILNKSGSSSNILSKPFVVTITYTQ
jgi:hypothetical protein